MFLYCFYEVLTCIGLGLCCNMKVIVNSNMCVLYIMWIQILP